MKILKNWNRFSINSSNASVHEIFSYLSCFSNDSNDNLQEIKMNINPLLSIFTDSNNFIFAQFFLFCLFFGFKKYVTNFTEDSIVDQKFVDWFRTYLDSKTAEILLLRAPIGSWLILITNFPGMFELKERRANIEISTIKIYHDIIKGTFYTATSR